MANSVDPDQEQSDLGLHCLHMPFLSDIGVQNFRTFTALNNMLNPERANHNSSRWHFNYLFILDKQTVHMKCQVWFLRKKLIKKIRMLSAIILLSTLKVNLQSKILVSTVWLMQCFTRIILIGGWCIMTT